MCGIIGVVSHSENIYDTILLGLKKLQNRGYDSAGVCLASNTSFAIEKQVSTENQNAISLLDSIQLHDKYKSSPSSIGMAHSRWATHGEKTIVNSHPHICYRGEYSLIHNGIMENFYDVMKFLEAQGIYSVSETDTEVVVNLISYLRTTHSMNETFESLNRILKGSWAFVIMCKSEPDMIYFMRYESPLLIGYSESRDLYILASEISGFDANIREYICLKDNDFGSIKRGILTHELTTQYTYEPAKLSAISYQSTPYPFEYWTEKEIYDQPDALTRVLEGRIGDRITLTEFNGYEDNLRSFDRLVMMACGTSYHACNVGNKVFRELQAIQTVEVIDGAEFTDYDIPLGSESTTMVIMLSQSGETKDLHRCIQILRKRGVFIISMVNVENSMIARESDICLYLRAHREVAVASTKSFCNQTVLLIMFGIYLCQLKGIVTPHILTYMNALNDLPNHFQQMIEYSRTKCADLAKIIYKQEHSFVLGRGVSEWISKEGALKIKEISYQHAEGFAASNLKHGSMSLLCENFPVMIILPNDDSFSLVESICSEVKSRNAYVIVITNRKIPDNKYDYILYLPIDSVLFPLVSVVIFQFIGYFVALERKLNVDYPRHLAKVVSV
jgi:glucosamine--fructose-6-phosphate aminotransferase (isomerizing)